MGWMWERGGGWRGVEVGEREGGEESVYYTFQRFPQDEAICVCVVAPKSVPPLNIEFLA